MLTSVSPSELCRLGTAMRRASAPTLRVADARPSLETHQSPPGYTSLGNNRRTLQVGGIIICLGKMRALQAKTADTVWFCLTSNPGAYREAETIILVASGAKASLTVSVPSSAIERYAPYFREFLGQENDGGAPEVNDLIYRYINEFVVQNLNAFDSINETALRCIEDHLVKMLISSLETQSAAQVSNLSKSKLRLRIKDFINQNLDDPTLTPQKIAEACGISLSYLHKLFHITDTSVCRWILQQRLNLSKQRLSDPAYIGVPISRIAYDIGFNNQAHFSSKFKRQFGVSPKEVRARSQAGE